MQLHKHRSYNHVELLFALAIPGNKPGRNFCIWVTSYIMGYIIYNAKTFSESCKPCSHLYCLLKKIPDLFFNNTFPIFYISLLISPLTHFLLVHVVARRAGPWESLKGGYKHNQDILPSLVTAFLFLSVTFSQIIFLFLAGILTDPTYFMCLPLDQLTLARKSERYCD